MDSNASANWQSLQNITMPTHPTHFIATAIIILLVSAFSWTKLVPRKALKLPFYGFEDNQVGAAKNRWLSDSLNLLREGYMKFADKPFQIQTTEGPQVVLPPRFVDELKMLRDDKFPSAIFDLLQAKHTTFGAGPVSTHLNHTVKHDLNKNIAKLFPGMKEELDLALAAELPATQGWIPITVYPKITRVVCRISGRSFLGEDLCRNETWIDISTKYTRNAFQSSSTLRQYPPALRFLAKYFVPEIRQIWKQNSEAERLVSPILEKRARGEQLENYEKPNDYLQWSLEGLQGATKSDVKFHTRNLLALGAASIHTTSQMITSSLYDLAAHPEYIPILREEVNEVFEKFDGEWNPESMSQLKKMDSFVKESQRLGGAAVSSFQRRAAKNITLSDGTFIPAGTLLMAPSLAVSADESIYPDADTFDGLRYFKLRQRSKEDENIHQFTTTSKNMLHFGVGRHACPGRWFASAEIKMVLAELILEYDFKLKEGEGKPKSLNRQYQNMPNPTAQLLFKRREL